MAKFVRVCKVSEVPDPGRKLLEVGDRTVVLFHLEGEFYAIDDVCTHDDGPLGEGELEGYSIICPRHGARFDVRTGHAQTMPAVRSTAAYETKVEGEDVLLKVP